MSRYHLAIVIPENRMPHRLSPAIASLLSLAAFAAPAQTPPMTPDIVGRYEAPADDADYVKRVVMIPMRDGVKLYTVIVTPKGARNAPILLTRTPYNASARAQRGRSPAMLATLPQGDETFVTGGYIRVFQDVRGKYGSEGDYVMTRPLRGPLNGTKTDHATDAWDTIDWLVKNVRETNGKVGMLGSSYEGFTVLMALADPHPALKAAVPMSPMVDGWRGDDWFHNGAFRLPTLAYIASQTTVRGRGEPLATGVYDDYDGYLRSGSAAGYARRFGLDRLN
jgi:predicted acyl esterase